MTSHRRWSLEVESLGTHKVGDAVELLGAQGIGAAAIDPSRWLVWNLDDSSVEYLSAALRQWLERRPTEDSDMIAGLQSMLEDCEEWLASFANGERYPETAPRNTHP